MEELISKSLIEIIAKSSDKKFDITKLLDDTEDTLDNYSFALVTLITESVRRNWSEQDLKDYLVETIPEQNEEIVKSILEKYAAHKVRIFFSFSRNISFFNCTFRILLVKHLIKSSLKVQLW